MPNIHIAVYRRLKPPHPHIAQYWNIEIAITNLRRTGNVDAYNDRLLGRFERAAERNHIMHLDEGDDNSDDEHDVDDKVVDSIVVDNHCGRDQSHVKTGVEQGYILSAGKPLLLPIASTEPGEMKCAVCFECVVVLYTFSQCGHRCVCVLCAQRLKQPEKSLRCPICQLESTHVMRVFDS